MGIFHTSMGVESPGRRGVIERLPHVLVDTGAELSWVPTPMLERLGIAREKRARRFQMADGGVLLGARTLEGLNLRVDVQAKRFVAGGPSIAASAA